MNIKPYVIACAPFLRNDGTIDEVPIQVMTLPNGAFEIRIGRNMLSFTPDGKLNGLEMKGGDDVDMAEAQAALLRMRDSTGKLPDEQYYQPHTAGWDREIQQVAFCPKREPRGSRGYVALVTPDSGSDDKSRS